jgi:hypothetical protein
LHNVGPVKGADVENHKECLISTPIEASILKRVGHLQFTTASILVVLLPENYIGRVLGISIVDLHKYNDGGNLVQNEEHRNKNKILKVLCLHILKLLLLIIHDGIDVIEEVVTNLEMHEKARYDSNG